MEIKEVGDFFLIINEYNFLQVIILYIAKPYTQTIMKRLKIIDLFIKFE